MEVVPLEWASAEQVAPKVLERERPSVQDPAQLRVMVDPRTNSVVVVAAPQDMPSVLAAIAELDVKTP
jgi:type II secretory pathway component GspD/PulD (secretin)